MADTPDRPEPSDAAPDVRPAPDAFGRRPLIERLGLAVIALGLGALFAVVGIASFVGGRRLPGGRRVRGRRRGRGARRVHRRIARRIRVGGHAGSLPPRSPYGVPYSSK